MNKKTKDKIISIVFIVLVLIISSILNKNNDNSIGETVAEGVLEAHFIDVGQGDSSLIKTKNNAVLIDAGTKGAGDKVVEYLKDHNIEKLDYIIATHPHEDHIGGIYKVIENFQVENIIMPNVVHTTKTFENLLDTIEKNKVDLLQANVGDEYKLGDSVFTIVAPNSSEYKNLNDYSVSIKLNHGVNSFLLTGDAEKLSEEEMVNKFNKNLNSKVLKAGHHGSDTSTTDEFLNMVNPEIAIISAGRDNTYGHPSPSIIEKLSKKGVSIYGTYEVGDIKIISDGENLDVKY